MSSTEKLGGAFGTATDRIETVRNRAERGPMTADEIQIAREQRDVLRGFAAAHQHFVNTKHRPAGPGGNL